MTPFTAEQLMAAHKANVEILFGLTNKAFEGVEKLVELNLQVAKSSLAEAAETTTAALSVKDAQELMALQAAGPNEIEREALAANGLAACYADCVARLVSAFRSA